MDYKNILIIKKKLVQHWIRYTYLGTKLKQKTYMGTKSKSSQWHMW